MQEYSMLMYLDNIATTRTDPAVSDTMNLFSDEHYGNASSIHSAGIKAAAGIEKARNIIAARINASPEEIFFTSGGTESNNWALKGVFFANRNKGNHMIVSSIEHPSIIETAKWLAKNGSEISFVPVDNQGFVNTDDIRKLISKKTILVSVMHANNETGTIQPIQEIGSICKEYGIYFHTDACQSFTKLDIDVQKQNLDMVTVNAHKIHGPKGIGALYIKSGTKIESLLHGGGQENNQRSGTYNTPAIAGFGKAVEIASLEDATYMKNLRDYFFSEIKLKTEDVHIHGPKEELRLCNNINIGFGKVPGKYLFTELNKRGIIISLGSACSSTKLTPSYVLTAMGCDHDTAHCAVRIGLSKWTTQEEIDLAIHHICEIVNDKRNEKRV